MVRTQIYLTQRESAALKSLASQTGKSQSELIRTAVDDLIERLSNRSRRDVLDRIAGMWKTRRDLPEFGELRRSWDRDNASITNHTPSVLQTESSLLPLYCTTLIL
jgi:hypothetical protein